MTSFYINQTKNASDKDWVDWHKVDSPFTLRRPLTTCGPPYYLR